MYPADEKDWTGPETNAEPQRQIPPTDPVLRTMAAIFSLVFHPLFIPFYITCFLAFVHPFAFAGMDDKLKVLRVISVFLLTAFFPAFTVFLLRRLHFIQTIFLRTQKERIIPYVATMFFYFWIFYVTRNLADSSPLFVAVMLGAFISSIAALMANIYFKVSMHGIAMGALLTFFIFLALLGNIDISAYLALATLIAGIVCTSRLLISDHYPFEVYAGFFLGMLSQLIAFYFV